MNADQLKNAKIRLTRATSSKIAGTYTANPAGHPIFDFEKNYLYIGDGDKQVASLKPITTNRIEDTNFSISADTSYTTFKSNKTIDFKIGTESIFTVSSRGISCTYGNEISAPTFRGDLVGDVTGNADSATGVTTNIGNYAISDIFETDGKTAKTATNSTYANYYRTPVNATYTSATVSISNIQPFTLYNCSYSSGITSLTISALNSVSSASNPIVDEYIVKFKAGSNLKVTLPSTVKIANGFDLANDFEAGMTYIIYIIATQSAPLYTAFISYIEGV